MKVFVTIEAEQFWYSEPTKAQLCCGCGEVICSDVYKPILQLGVATDLNFVDIPVQLCKSCYDQNKEKCH